MADREYIIEILLKARDETARAFAAATGNLETYDRLLEEQRVKTEAAKRAQQEYAKEFERGDSSIKQRERALEQLNLRNSESVKRLNELEQAQRKVTQAQAQGKGRTAEYTLLVDRLAEAEQGYAKALGDLEGRARNLAEIEARSTAQRVAAEERLIATVREQGRARQEVEKIIQSATRPAEVLARTNINQQQEIRATQELAAARDQLRASGLSVEEADRRIHAVRQQALHDYGFENQAARDAARVSKDEAEAYKLVEQALRRVETARRSSTRSRQGGTQARVDPQTQRVASTNIVDEAGGAGGALSSIQSQFAGLDTSVKGFDASIRNSFGFAAVALIQPVAALIVGLVGAFASLASAAIAAGTAVSATFLSSMAQGIPIMGLFAAAMQRLQTIFGYVSTVAQQAQQRFIAQYQYQKQVAMGIDPIVAAEHNLSDALFAQQQAVRGVSVAQHSYSDALFTSQQAVRGVTVAEHSYNDAVYALQQSIYNVRVAQLALLTARQSAARQLQELTFQEIDARLAAEASTLAITDSQKALAAAIAQGGDVQQAQLQLAQAHVQHSQSVTHAQQAIADAAPGSIARQNIQQQVDQASRAVDQARRAVVDAQFAAEQARIGITQAQRAVVDAQFQLAQAQIGITQSRRAVVDSQFQVAQARAAIIQARQAATGYNLATAAQLAYLRSQMTQTEKSLADNILRIYKLFQGVHGYMRPITDAILGAFIPLTDQIYKTLTNPRIFGALLNLGRAIGNVIGTLTKTVFDNQSINNFIRIINAAAENLKPLAVIISGLFRGLQAVVVAAIPYVHQFAGFVAGLVSQFANWANSTRGQNWLAQWFKTAFGALESFIRLGASVVKLVAAVVGVGGGAQSGIRILSLLQSWVDRTTKSINAHGSAWHTLQQLWSAAIPSVKAIAQIIGAILHGFIQLAATRQGQQALAGVANVITHILVPAFVKFAENMGKVAVAITSFLSKHPGLEKALVSLIAAMATIAVGSKAIGLIFGPLSKVIGGVGKLIGLLQTVGPLLLSAFSDPVVLAIAAIAAAITGIAAATGNLTNLKNAVIAPFVQAWNSLKAPFRDLGKQITNFINTILAPFGVHFKSTFSSLHGVVAVFLEVVKKTFGLAGIFMVTPIRIFARIFATVLGTATTIIKGIESVIKGFFDVFVGLIHGNLGRVLKGFKEIGKGILDGIWAAISFLPKMVIGIFSDAIKALLKWLGISSPSKRFYDIGFDMLKGLLNGLLSLGKDIVNFGVKIVDWIVKGITSTPGKILKAFESILPGPLKSLLSGAVGVGKDIIKGGLGLIGIHIGQQGGPVGGGSYGGGDRWPFMLEGGEHILTKEEVRSAGGHSAIFSLRRALGGGGQGGPGGYAQGGAVQIPQAITSLGIQSQQGQTTQGVTGLLGSTLANLQDFIKQFDADWTNFWKGVNSLTKSNIAIELKQFHDFFVALLDNWKSSDNSTFDEIKIFWTRTNALVKQQLDVFQQNFKNAYKVFDTDTFNAFWYVTNASKKALSSFGAKYTPPQLGAIPKFAQGGMVGQMGERGRDIIHAVLGRGEAVLNWAHQRFVEPALRSYYGFGLDRLFQKVRGEHSGGDGYVGESARPNKFAGGGYVFPFPKNQPFSWERIDQGQDLKTTPGGVVLAIAPGIVSPASDRFGGFGGHYATEQITAGPLAGRGVYYGHIWATRFGQVQPGDVIGRTQTAPDQWTAAPEGWLELGFLPYGSMTAGNAIAPILRALAAGHQVFGIGGAGGVGVTWNNIKNLTVRGTGVLADTLRAAINKVTGAANAFGQKQAGQSTAVGGSRPGTVPGPVVTASWFDDPTTASGHVHVPGFAELSNPPGAHNWSALGGLPMGELIDVSYGGRTITIPRVDVGAGGSPLPGATVRAIDLTREAALMLPGFIQAGLANVTWRDRHKRAFAEGGFVGGARKIVAHVGEWVLNTMQQSKLAKWIGTSRDVLRSALGLDKKREQTHFADGGVVGHEDVHTRDVEDVQAPVAGVFYPNPRYSRKTGAYLDQGGIIIDTPAFTQQAIREYNRGQALILRKIEANGKNFAKGLKQFLENFNKVGGDNGLFALAVQAIQNFANEQSAVVQLAAAGIRIVNHALRFGRPQTAVQQAQTDLRATQVEIRQIEGLRREQVQALRAVNEQIKRLGRPNAKNLAQWQQLMGARQQLLNYIYQSDQTLAQAMSDRYQKVTAVFQARVQQALRGPGIQTGLAQLDQTLAQTFGDPIKLLFADQDVIRAAEATRVALDHWYQVAADKAQRDPRWQAIADDLRQQLESSVETLVQAQAQAINDAIQNQDTKRQLAESGFTLRDTLASVLSASSIVAGPANQYAAIGLQLSTAQQRSQSIQTSLGQYQSLLAQAQRLGDFGAVNTLTQTINDLIGSLAQVNLQIQQLVTSQRQLAVTIMSAQSQASSGFFQAAQGIAQTLGAIAGNQNLPALIRYAHEVADSLKVGAQQIAATIRQALSPNAQGQFAFGANQGGAAAYLDQLVTASQQGPQAFADTLARISDALATFESGLPQDQLTLFQGLVQALIDNTTAQVNNTQQLQQLNATTNQQDFASSAWTMFRQAIFTGAGQLLPKYASTIPTMDVGGYITRSGILYGHTGEEMVPAGVSRPYRGSGVVNNENHFHIDHPLEVADPVLLSNQIGWKLANNPNSR